MSELKVFADDNLDDAKMMGSEWERKHPGKRRKCCLQVHFVFSPFPTMVSEGFYLSFIKTWDCVVKN